MLQGQCGHLTTKLQRFLYFYRNTPHSTTGKAPSALMFNRKLLARFDQILPKILSKNRKVAPRNQGTALSNKRFEDGDQVYARDYSRPNKRGWLPAKVIERLGNYLYLCEAMDGRILKRHVDQLIAVGNFYGDPNPPPDFSMPLPSDLSQTRPLTRKAESH
ncbi:Hypothetical Protein NTJ_02593 [Nesidiocoris tenuis]|nr:Hypothetical Protein NTJ_02593 [Nesidiocoris tenuis]